MLGNCCWSSPHDGGGKGRRPAFSGCKTDGGGALAPLLRVGLCAGQRVPWLDADKADRLCQRAPDQLVRKILNIADDVPPAVFFINAQRSGPQPRHAEAVVGKQIIGQLDLLGIFPFVIALSAEQPMGPGIQNDRAFRPVKPELVILCGMVTVKGDVECGMKADAEAQLLAAGIFHGQSVADRPVLQPERAAQNKIKGELRRLKLRAGTQLQDFRVGSDNPESVAVLPPESGHSYLRRASIAVHATRPEWHRDCG